ncbi:MAG: DUF2878 domain-containing protein [Halioglobus sp.]
MNYVMSWRGPQTDMLYTLMNGLLFNISWFAIIYTQSTTLAPLLVSLHLLAHFSLMGRGLPEGAFIIGVTMLGILVDQTLFYLGVFTVNGQAALPPLWITCLWPVLATTCMHAFRGLSSHLWLAALFGGIGGAGSYLAGTGLTDVQFASTAWGPWIMAAIWMILFPALLFVARMWINGMEAADASS